MNIWIVNAHAVPTTMPGVTRQISLAREFLKRGHEVAIISGSFNYNLREEVILEPGQDVRLEEYDGVKMLWLRTSPYQSQSQRVLSMLSFVWRYRRRVGFEMLAKPDIVLSSAPHLFASWAVHQVARKDQIPHVFEVRDLWPQTLIDLGGYSRWHPFIWLLDKIERYLYRNADWLISVLPLAADFMVERGAHPERITWLPNGVELSLLPPQVPPPTHQKFTIMFAGAMAHSQNIPVILQAAKILQEQGWEDRVQFRIVGDGLLKQEVLDFIQDEDLRIVRHEDAVPKEDVYRLLMEADVLVASLRKSSLYRWGISLNKINDYMAVQRPIVFASDTDYNPVGLANAGLVVPAGDFRAMADAFIQLYQMPPEERQTLGNNGGSYIQHHHSITTITQQIEEIFVQVIQEREGFLNRGHDD